MKQYMRQKKLMVILLLMLLMVSSCTNELELQNGPDWIKLCTEWGTTSTKIKDMMKTYTRLNSSSNVIVYKGKGDVDAVSYRFLNDSLCASAIVMKSDVVEVEEIRNTFSRYESLGEYNGNELYLDNNQLVTIKEYYKNEESYIVVGYSLFED